jgi:hypothetical protein
VYRWLREDVEAEMAELRSVALVGPVESRGTRSGLTLVTPSGIRVEGLSVEDVATLLRDLP